VSPLDDLLKILGTMRPFLSMDELHTKAVEAIGLIKSSDDVQACEEVLCGLLTCAYQVGLIEANNAHIQRMKERHSA